ncbi:TetR/AcrR family transcriptional regulator [Nonomuraea sp. KC401]|uniref:TetR/AcrR family transcriptional regulator n=1 Tax=unclassified Nonomuraea TaxID=2593643 RepID=UPI0010FE8EE7|nr:MULTISPECIES: TetR/AcrR family transcriptional regulator [unclassified Nonomuraea]NBE97090.1 TetR family transcriptional regulator [Nonomuraea sp. K271]TLF66152.1 TetR/AcrR family transcriptional regulator [Nonomuraea sp. KC401]
MTSTRRTRGRPRDPEADEAIMKAALELFVERGLEGANVEQIAKRAGVAKVTVYRRWSSKEELLTQAIERARTLAPEADLWAGADAAASPADERLMDSWVRTFGDPRFRAVLAQLIGSSVTRPSLLATYREQYIEPRRRLIHAALERARRDGRVDADADLDTVIDMVVGAAMYRMLIDPDAPAAPDTTRAYLERVLRQVDRLLRRPDPPEGST